MPTARFEPWQIVRVPFPYVERPALKHRPALVIACLDQAVPLLWLMMITSIENRPWAGDIPVSDLSQAGLPHPSVIRCAKLATLEAAACEVLGSLSLPDGLLVKVELERILQPLKSGVTLH